MIPLQDTHPLSKFPFWTTVIILVNIYVFYLEITSSNPDSFISKYALIPEQIDLLNISTLFPLISSQFLHAGFIHIISNMLFLFVFGNNVEASLGFFVYPIFYLTAGAVAGLTQYFFTPSDLFTTVASIPILGASGAVAGVLGSYFALFPHHKIKTLVFIFIFITIIDIPAYILLFYWFVTQFFSGLAALSLSTNTGGIAFFAHVGGFLFGFFASFLVATRKNEMRFKFM